MMLSIAKLLKAKLLFFDESHQEIFQLLLNNEIVQMWLETGVIDYSLRKKTGENLLELAKKNHLSIEKYLIRED